MADPNHYPSSSSSSIFPHKNSTLPDDTVFFSIFPDFSLPTTSTTTTTTTTTSTTTTSQLQSLHLQILQTLSPFTSTYLWHHQPFSLSPSTTTSITTPCFCSTTIPHLHGKLHFSDNLDDEWFLVFLLFHLSHLFPNLSILLWDTDGQFLLIETAFHLPRWLNPDTATNRIFLRNGHLHIIPLSHFPHTPSLSDSLTFLTKFEHLTQADDSIQFALKTKISEYPERAKRNIHSVRVSVPVSVAHVLKHEPCLVSLAVEGFYDRDIDSMKFAGEMGRFMAKRSGEEMVTVNVRMSRAMYVQLVQQAFAAPKWYPIPGRSDVGGYLEAELGMKIACGFEMMYQMRKKEGVDGKGSTWEKFKESLEGSGYFEGLLPGSKEYKRLMENAEEYYRNSSLHSRTSEMMNAPVRRIDEILALSHSSDDFPSQDVPPSDDDSWLYSGEDELNAALQERQKEMEHYNLKHKKKPKSKEHQDAGPPSGSNLDDYGLGDIAKSMQAFVQKMSSYEGAEVPENGNLGDVDLDVDRFMKDMEAAMRHPGSEDAVSDADSEEVSSLDMDFDESDDSEEEEDTFMHSYSGALDEELKTTTLNKSFIRANEQQPVKKDEGTSNAMDEEFTPVDVDVNLVKSFLDSFSSQQGLPGPASNLLGLMGLHLPQDANKDK